MVSARELSPQESVAKEVNTASLSCKEVKNRLAVYEHFQHSNLVTVLAYKINICERKHIGIKSQNV